MNRRIFWTLATCAAGLLVTIGVAGASIQGRESVCTLGMGLGTNWHLCERDGRVWMADTKYEAGKFPRWHLSAPDVKDDDGRYLACDPTGTTQELRLVREPGPNTRWIFELDSELKPGKLVSGLKAGPAGYTLKLQMAEGPFKGWYLAADEPAALEEGKPKRMLMRLVEDPKKGWTTFTYVREKYKAVSK